MADLRVITPTGVEAALGESIVEEFASNLRGGLLRSGDPGYEEARLVWNDLIDKRPAIIARCAGADDVIDSVNFAGFLEEGEKLLHEAHGKNHERLLSLKTKYDSTNLFRLNHNINPTV